MRLGDLDPLSPATGRFADEIRSMKCAADANGEDALDDLRLIGRADTSAARLLLAQRASQCNSASAALIVFRVMPAGLLERVDGKELNQVYGFLKRDRKHALELFRTLLSDPTDALGPGLDDAPEELRREFRPEQVLSATCAELAGITPQHPSQLRYAHDLLVRNHCDDEVVPLLLRSLKSASKVRGAACDLAEHFAPELVAEIAEAAATDPGEPVYETEGGSEAPRINGITDAIVQIIVSPVVSTGPTRKLVGTDQPGKWQCEPSGCDKRLNVEASARSVAQNGFQSNNGRPSADGCSQG